MPIPDQDSLEYLLQIDILEDLRPLVGTEQWQSLYISRDDEAWRFGLWCALLNDDAAEHSLAKAGWDLSIGSGKPGFSRSWLEGDEVTSYDRYGPGEGVRPLVHRRSFHGAFPAYCELDEEFRLYHDLAHDPSRGLLLSFDDSGREVEVVRIETGHVRARLKYLRQYQAGTRQHLAIYVDSVRYSRLPLENVGERRDEAVSDRSRWHRVVAACDFRTEYETLSRVLLKVILPPPPLERAGVWPFGEDRNETEVSFIIEVDEDGDNIEHSSNPDSLSNYFGANPRAPHYLTPVFFRREVLAKYYAEPERYTVSDGQLSCLGLWSCQIDNDLGSHVVVYLGDLGRDLPYEERLHWRQFNVPPEGGISQTNFRRSFLAQFTEPEAPDLVFKGEYASFSRDWESKYEWPFFVPLAPGDAHLLDTVRVPVANSQAEMDDQVLNLTKLLVDSLNEREFAKAAPDVPEGAKGIAKLEAFFASTKFAGGDSIVRFLRDLQQLRSTGSGHRKGRKYDKAVARLGVDPSRKPDVIARLLEEAVGVMRVLRATYIEEE